jgi:hypothetical protein
MMGEREMGNGNGKGKKVEKEISDFLFLLMWFYLF